VNLPEVAGSVKTSQERISSVIYQTYKPKLFLSYTQGYFDVPDVLFSQKNTLVASPSLASSSRVFGSLVSPTSKLSTEKGEITEYLVQEGDTISSIAKKFNLSAETIYLNNNLSKNSTLKPGKTLIILPIDGLVHYVADGDTLNSLAKAYSAKVQDIIDYNDIGDEGQIFTGDILVIPYAKKPVVKYETRIAKPLPSSYFICPITAPCRITQGLHWYNAIDFSHGECGEPVLAAAGGTVQKTGFSSVAGNYVRILHPNGVVSFYGHLSKILVSTEQKVVQGQTIGQIGYSGYTIPRGPSGCHLHFEVRGAENPFKK
jgi:murein DD-endopeptidase MepM/ murein hydrolase activator NlpD